MSPQPSSPFRNHKHAADPAVASSIPVSQYDYSRDGQMYVVQTAQESERKIVGSAPPILALTTILVALAIGLGTGIFTGMAINNGSADNGSTLSIFIDI